MFWLSFQPRGIPDEIVAHLNHLVEAVVPPIERLSHMVALGTKYFRTKSEAQRERIKSLIRDIGQCDREADHLSGN